MTKVGQVEVPSTFETQLTVLATANPLAEDAKKAMSEEAAVFKKVMEAKNSITQNPSQATVNNVKAAVSHCVKLYEKTLTDLTKKYVETRNKDPRIIFGIGPRILFGSPESNDLYKRKSTLEKHKAELSALLKKVEAEDEKLTKANKPLTNRQLILAEKQDQQIASMTYEQLKNSLPDFSKMSIEVAGASQKSPKDLFGSLNRLLDLRLDGNTLATRAAFFEKRDEKAPEVIEGPTADLHVLKYCTQASYQYIVQELNDVCNKHRTMNEKSYFVPQVDVDTLRKIYIKKLDGAVEVRVEMPVQLIRTAGEEPFAKVDALLTVRIAADGKTTMKCLYNNVYPYANASVVEKTLLSRVFHQEAKVTSAAKA